MRPIARPESWRGRVGRTLGFYGRRDDDALAAPGTANRRASELRVKGKAMQCPMCANNTFWRREGKLQTTGMTLLGLDAFNASAVCHVCSDCGYILWFVPS